VDQTGLADAEANPAKADKTKSDPIAAWLIVISSCLALVSGLAMLEVAGIAAYRLWHHPIALRDMSAGTVWFFACAAALFAIRRYLLALVQTVNSGG
jgi:hypothetical protein